MKIKVGILGSRDLCCKITNWIATQNEVEIVGVVVPPFSGWWKDELRELCKSLSLKTYENPQEMMKENPEILFSINYWKKIEKDIINSIPKGIVNIHHSYLLKYKGRYSTSWAIINARKLNHWLHGTTLHFIDENLDEGKIIGSYSCEITEDDTSESLFNKVEILAFRLFKDFFPKIIHGSVENFLEEDKNSFFYDVDSNKNLEIPYGTPIEEVYDFVRAWSFKDRPKPFFNHDGKKIYLSIM